MPRERMEIFLAQVAHRLRDGTVGVNALDAAMLANARAKVVVRIADEQRAIAQAIASDDFRSAMADAYASELANYQPGVLLDEARRETDSIINNRIEDCKNFVRLLAQPDFIGAVQTQSLQPPTPPKPYMLSQSKIVDEIDSLVLPNRASGAQPAVHVAMSARGHQVGHQALADIFRPQTGSLRAPLIAALAHAWPKASGEEIEHLAQTWLKARHDPAHSVADALKPDGIIYKAAMAKSEALQQQKLGLATPTTITEAPRMLDGKLQHIPLSALASPR